jgi:hypothetical protein
MLLKIEHSPNQEFEVSVPVISYSPLVPNVFGNACAKPLTERGLLFVQVRLGPAKNFPYFTELSIRCKSSS